MEVPTLLTEGRKLAVLAVDDDALVLMNTSAMLQDLGHEVDEAGSGAQALEAMRHKQADVVITDQAMPHMTGLQLAEAFHAQWPSVPIIIATGYTELPETGRKHRVLNKPFGIDDLRAALEDITEETNVVRLERRI